jgi:hypothetical protein
MLVPMSLLRQRSSADRDHHCVDSQAVPVAAMPDNKI